MKFRKLILLAAIGLSLFMIAKSVYAVASTSALKTKRGESVYSTADNGTTSNLNMTITPAAYALVHEFRMHANSATNGTLTISVDKTGTLWDATLFTVNLTALAVPDYYTTFPVPIRLGSSDSLKIEWVNGENLTWGAEAIWSAE